MGKGKRTVKATVVEEPMTELLEAEVSEPEGSGSSREVSDEAELVDGALSEGDEEEEDSDEDEELTEESLKKVMEMLGPEALAELEAQQGDEAAENGEEDDEEQDDDEENDLEGSESDDDEEPLPSTKTDPVALDRVLKTFKLDTSFFDTQTVTYPEPLDIPDAGDDLSREVQFYKQSLWAANEARQRFLAADKPFARPSDYYAEMVKTDAHMERIRQRLLDERASMEASEKAKAQRQLKKFGKQVQVAKLQERQQAKKALENKVKDFKNKKKRDANSLDDTDQFAVELEDDERPTKKPRGIVIKRRDGKGQDGKPKMPREARNARYGHPSGGKHSKQNTKESSGDLSGFNRGRKSQKGKTQRPGKSKRAAKR